MAEQISIQQIEQLLSMSVQDIYEALGQELESGLSLAESDPDSRRERGRRWFAKNREVLRQHLCETIIAKLVVKQPHQWDRVLLVAALADLIITLKLGISPITVGALLVKEGLADLCQDESKP